jgi:hypothetical protein
MAGYQTLAQRLHGDHPQFAVNDVVIFTDPTNLATRNSFHVVDGAAGEDRVSVNCLTYGLEHRRYAEPTELKKVGRIVGERSADHINMTTTLHYDGLSYEQRQPWSGSLTETQAHPDALDMATYTTIVQNPYPYDEYPDAAAYLTRVAMENPGPLAKRLNAEHSPSALGPLADALDVFVLNAGKAHDPEAFDRLVAADEGFRDLVETVKKIQTDGAGAYTTATIAKAIEKTGSSPEQVLEL